MLYKCNGTALSLLSFATRVTAEFAQFTENSTKDKSPDIIYVYKYCYIFSQVKSTIEIFCYLITETQLESKR